MEVLSKLRPACSTRRRHGDRGQRQHHQRRGLCCGGDGRRKGQAELGIKPLVRVGAQGAAGLDPKYVLVAPIYSIPKACAKAGMDPRDVRTARDSTRPSPHRRWRCSAPWSWTRPGSTSSAAPLSIGHPIGASGARVLTTLIYAMKGTRRGHGHGQSMPRAAAKPSLLLVHIYVRLENNRPVRFTAYRRE